MPDRDADLLRENERLRKENRILRDLRRIRQQSLGLLSRRKWEVLKKAVQFFADKKSLNYNLLPDILAAFRATISVA